MAALLVSMAVMAIVMTAAMPVWRQITQREKEEELVFRGKQYARAIGLFERKYANTPPPDLDVRVRERFLRRKYKDPVTGEDFAPVLGGQAVRGSTQPGPGGPAATPARGQPVAATPQVGGAATGRGIIGVASKSKDKSIRIYNGQTHYNEWAFVYAPPAATPGAGGVPGVAVPGQRGGQRGQPGPPGVGPGGRGPGAPSRGRGAPGPDVPGPFGPARGQNPFQPVFPTAPNAPGRGR